jgi:serine/threonine protein kinase/tetratricopeptide (TPR) repeat protein
MNSQLPSVETLFAEALELASADERAAYLEQACAGDEGLRRQVETLLEAHERAGRFLEPPGLAATADLPRPAEGPGTVIGPYKLLEPIGEGGMGVVFMAEQSQPVRRMVAVKVIKPGMDTKQFIARFEAERQALALMDHPNIARVLDGGATESGRPYFVMELVRGIPITDYCDREQLSITERLDLFVLVCRAVQHAHQKGVIHRDLKPSNVLVTVIDGVAVPKVIDFGVAKATGPSLTERTLLTGFHQFVGTPLYMSPEQADLAGVDVDTRSDVYSLGVLLYELLTGTTPFDRETFRTAALDEVRRVVREEEPPTPSTRLSTLGESLSTVSAKRKTLPRQLRHAVRGELDWVVMKALEKDRNRRYETANDFASDVTRCLTGRPVEAGPPSAMYRLRKYTRRHRAALGTAAVVGVALVAGTAVSTWQAFEARKARRETLGALAVAQRAERQASRRYEVARRAVDDMYTQVALRWLAQQPQLEDVQREFLEKALAAYLEFSREAETRPETRADVARAYLHAGQIQQTLNRHREAEASLRAAVERLGSLSEEFPDNTDYRADLAEAHNSLAILEDHLGRDGDAEQDYRKAIALIEQLAARPGAPTKSRGVLAIDLNNFGIALSRRGLDKEAEAVLRRAKELAEPLGSKPDADPVDRDSLAAVCDHLALAVRKTGRLDEALELQKRSRDLYAALAAEFPSKHVHRLGLAAVLTNLGNTLKTLDRVDEAEPVLREATALFDRLAIDFPRIFEYRQDQASGYENLGNVLKVRRRFDEAERAYLRALEIRWKHVADFPDRPDYRDRLASTFMNLGALYSDAERLDEAEQADRKAAELYQRLATEYPRMPEYRKVHAFALTNLSEVLMNEGRTDETRTAVCQAADLFEALASEFPTRPEYKVYLANSLNRLGVLEQAVGQTEAALSAHRRSIGIRERLASEDPRSPDRHSALGGALNNLAVVLRDLDRNDEARPLLRRALEQQRLALQASPRNRQFQRFLMSHHTALGECLILDGDHEGASRVADELVRDLPESSQALTRSARFLIRSIPLTCADVRLETPQRERACRAYAERARWRFQEAVRLAGGDPLALAEAARLLASASVPEFRDPPQAVALARRATEMAPERGVYWTMLGQALYRAGEWSAAIEALTRAMGLQSGGNAEEWYFLAMAHWQRGENDEARSWLDKAVAWTDRRQPRDDDLRRVRDEATALIGLAALPVDVFARPHPR